MSYFELGGFAEDVDVLDGTEETFRAFNFCLAEEYLNAIYLEDFEAIGEIDSYLMENVCYWLDYDGKHGNQEVIQEIKNGTLITKNNRTFIDAIYECRNACCAEFYINNGIITPKLILTILLSNDTDDIRDVYLVNLDQDKLEKTINDLCELIEQEFEKNEDKENFVNLIKNNWSKMKINKQCKSKPVSEHYNWVKYLKKVNSHSHTLDK